MLDFPAWKKLTILGVCLLGIIFSMPNLWYDRADTSARATAALEAGAYDPADQAALDQLRSDAELWPSYLPPDVISLGLDLRGGVHMLVEVQVDEVISERLTGLRLEAFNSLRDAGLWVSGDRALLTGDVVEVRLQDAERVAAARQVIDRIPQPVNAGVAGFTGQFDVDVSSTDGGFNLVLTEAGRKSIIDRTMAQSVEIMRRRIDESGTREPTIQRQGERRILIQVPGLGSSAELLDLIGKTAKLTFHEVAAIGAEARNPGIGQVIYPGAPASSFPGEPYLVEEAPILTGENLTDASLGFHHETGLPVVNFSFDTTGARIFGDYTAANTGRLFAVVLDGEVITAPRIQSPILGGSGFIEGQFTVDSASNLAILLRAGALPASITVEEERTVGPDLGADSIAAGQLATVLAFGGILIFMFAAYGRFGLFANIALIVNIALLFAFLSVIGATLTLPGIAGIVLTIGMAVDANVLIFERIKEELRAKKSPSKAVERGYEQALSAIIDANITTFIAAVILFAMGSGPVKGFAVTLGVGIITSVFTATMVTRLMVALWLRSKRPKSLRIHVFSMVPAGTKVNFLAGRKIAGALSVLLVSASIAGAAILGLNFGIDFRGGTLIEVQTEQQA
ncbi:MAG: protein translocase subunit SecD, partial [Pseudomonadota bacterium]